MGAGARALPPGTRADAKQMFSVGSLSGGLKVKLLELIADMNIASHQECGGDCERAGAFPSDPDNSRRI